MTVGLNLVLLGKTGAGKSSSGNTILGRQAFISDRSSKSVTQDITVQTGIVGDIPVNVYDTPGLFDSDMSEEEIQQIYEKVLQKCESGPCAFLLVIKADRFTEEERKTVEKIEKLLGEKRLKKTWILFTGGDELKEENMTIKKFIDNKGALKKLIQKYDQRYHVFNNKKGDTTQVLKLLVAAVPKAAATGAVAADGVGASVVAAVLIVAAIGALAADGVGASVVAAVLIVAAIGAVAGAGVGARVVARVVAVVLIVAAIGAVAGAVAGAGVVAAVLLVAAISARVVARVVDGVVAAVLLVAAISARVVARVVVGVVAAVFIVVGAVLFFLKVAKISALAVVNVLIKVAVAGAEVFTSVVTRLVNFVFKFAKKAAEIVYAALKAAIIGAIVGAIVGAGLEYVFGPKIDERVDNTINYGLLSAAVAGVVAAVRNALFKDA